MVALGAVAAFASLAASSMVLCTRGSHCRHAIHKKFLGSTWCQTVLSLSAPVCVYEDCQEGLEEPFPL